jgi:MFS transporter, SP family, arabinose:H+ symporter
MARTSTPASNFDPNGLSPKGSLMYLAAVCLVASIGGLLFGFDTAVISGTVESVKALYGLDEIREGWFGSSALVGCILGAAVAGVLSDRFGRKPVLLVSGVLFLASALLAAGAPNFDWLVWGRIIGGLGVGIASVAAPMYISEFSPPRLRGRLVASYQLSIVVGILAAYASNWLLNGFAQGHPQALAGAEWLHWIMIDEVWRAMFGVGAAPAVAFLALLLFMPESPRWLVKAGQTDDGLRILTKIGGAATAQRELAEIRQARSEKSGSIAELFQPGLRLALIVGVGLSVFGQLSGVNIVVYYGPKILKGAEVTAGEALRWQVVLGLINLVCTLIAMWKVDSWGRRPLLIRGMAAVTLSMAVTAGLYYWKAPPLAVVAMICVYMACEALSICGVIWVLTPEIFPNRVRGRAVSIAIFANWSTNWFSAFLFPAYVKMFGDDPNGLPTRGLAMAFLTFAVICLAATVFFWRFVPETKGKSLEEIERHWTGLGGRSSASGRS